jgi:hypothetical protein
MRFAIQCFGGIRCCLEHKHIENFIQIFPEIFNEGNVVDFFILTTKTEGSREINNAYEYLNGLLGERLKTFNVIEDMPGSNEKETSIIKRWNDLNTLTNLTIDELNEYKTELLSGIEIRTKKNLWVPSMYEELQRVDQAINGDQSINLLKDPFVPLLYYRRKVINSIRKKYQEDNGIHYDWVISSRMFDIIYNKRKDFDFLLNLPNKDIVYSSIDNIVMTTPENTDLIYEELGENYPVVGYEQWDNQSFKKTYNAFDIGIYYMRTISTYSSENQLLWQAMKHSKKFINLRCGCNFNEEMTDPSAYLLFHACDKRK